MLSLALKLHSIPSQFIHHSILGPEQNTSAKTKSPVASERLTLVLFVTEALADFRLSDDCCKCLSVNFKTTGTVYIEL